MLFLRISIGRRSRKELNRSRLNGNSGAARLRRLCFFMYNGIMRNKLLLLLIFSGIFLFTGHSSAHQPEIILGQTKIEVANPEISKAYYGELVGRPDYFEIQSSAPLDLYVNILVPAVTGSAKDFSVEIDKDGRTVANLDGSKSAWNWYYEPFGGDNYWKGPEYDAQVGAGNYEIKVSNPTETGKYVLAIGKKESFTFGEAVNAFVALPKIKKDFFGESTLAALLNQDTLLLILALASLVIIIFLLYWAYRRTKVHGTGTRKK